MYLSGYVCSERSMRPRSVVPMVHDVALGTRNIDAAPVRAYVVLDKLAYNHTMQCTVWYLSMLGSEPTYYWFGSKHGQIPKHTLEL